MTKDVLTKEELFSSIDKAVLELVNLTLVLDENTFNAIPYPDSWTAGQLIRHVTKSTNAMAKAMLAEPKPAERNPVEKVPQLKNIFLDFSHKLKSPEFIIPENQTYNKQLSVDGLNQSFEKLKENTGRMDLNDIVEDLPLGPTTKLELLHFVLYHTQRHLYQMRRICESLKM